MYIVGLGQKIKNVKNGEIVRNFYSGEKLPKDYEPPKSYIEQKIVIEVKKGGK